MLYTTCPICRKRYRLHHGIARAQGIAECSKCDTVFDSLVAIQETDTAAEMNSTGQSEIPDATVQVGDRHVIRPSGFPPVKPWFPNEEISAAIENSGLVEEAEAARRFQISGGKIAFLSLALRNLIRYRRRSGIALGAIVFGVVAILLAGGFIEWILEATRESAIRSQFGHVQLVRSGYFDRGAAEPLAFLLPAANELISDIEQQPGVDTVAQRVYFSGLASRDETTLSFIGQGVDPVKEERMSESVDIRNGVDLEADDPSKIIVGAGLADTLGVGPGDSLVLLATSSTGGINAVEVVVNGIFMTAAKAFDDAALRVHIDTARELLKIDGSHSWLVLLDETNQTDDMVTRLREMLADKNEDYEVIPWYDLADFYNKTEQLFSRQINLMWIVIGLLILLSISNTMMMSVLERTREIGTLMAVGLTRKSILRLFLQEGAVLGIVGGTVGLALGIGLASLISYIGIPMPPPPGMEEGFTAEILVTGGLITAGMFIAVVTTTAASAYPAWKASRLDIVDALRHNQ